MRLSIECLVFDLDGTLTDSRIGILRSIRYAAESIGQRIPDDYDLTGCLGPPLPRCFESILQTREPEIIERAVAAYRERYELLGMFENELYPGIIELLRVLHPRIRLELVTAKPKSYAETIVKHFDIRRYFGSVHGPEKEDRDYTKARLLSESIQSQGLDTTRTAMVADRGDDVRAARSNQVISIAAAWGYGSREELEKARPDILVHSPTEVIALIKD